MLLYLIACEPVALKVDDSGATYADDSGDTDTTVIDDSGTAPDDSGTVVDDSGTTPTLPEGDLTFTFDRDATGDTLTLSQLSLADFTTFGDTLAEADIDGGQVSLTLAPDASQLEELPDYPGVQGALFVPGVVGVDGTYVAVGYAWPLYLSGDLPADLRAFGLSEGWNVLVSNGGDTPSVGDTGDIPVAWWFAYIDTVTVGGTWGGDATVSEVGIALAPGADAATSVLFDEIVATAEPWSLTVDGEPPASHVELDGGLATAVEVPVSYADADASGGISSSDTLLTYACLDADVAMLIWADPPETAQGAYNLAGAGAAVGWNAFAVSTTDGSFTAIDATTPLVLSTACGF